MPAFLRVQRPDDTQLQVSYAENLRRLDQMQAQRIPQDLALLGALGEQARSLGHLEASRKYLEAALKLAREYEDPAREVANLIRLGTTLQYLNRHQEGEAFLLAALEKTDAPATCLYHDFALQHLGKLYAELGRYAEARNLFEQALHIRQQKDDPGLIRSTKQALQTLESLIQNA